MKYAILGAGAMGSLIGAFLVKGGQQVVLVDPYKEHMEKIRNEGLELTLGQKTEIIKIDAVSDPDHAGVAEVIIVLVKSMLTESALKGAAALFGPNTFICTLQNGLGNTEIIKSICPPERILQGVMKIASTLKEPGKVVGNVSGDTAIYLGSIIKDGAAREIAKEVVSHFKAGGLNAEYSKNVEYDIWSKAVNNIALNAACGIVRLRIKEYFNHPQGRQILHDTVKEVVAVAAAKGINLDDNKILAIIENSTVPKIGDHYPSTAQDIRNKKKTEIDFLNGAISRYGKELGIPTPANDYITNFVRIIEDNYESQF